MYNHVSIARKFPSVGTGERAPSVVLPSPTIRSKAPRIWAQLFEEARVNCQLVTIAQSSVIERFCVRYPPLGFVRLGSRGIKSHAAIFWSKASAF